MNWRNRPTFELWRSIVHEIGVYDDLADVIGEWRKSGSAFLEAFALQLEDDWGGWQGWDRTDVDSHLCALAVHTFLARVDWLQIASRLVEHADSGPWPKHSYSGLDCWCRKPVRSWSKAEAADDPLPVTSAAQTEGREAIPQAAPGAVPGRMDWDILYSQARALDCAVRQLAPDKREQILAAGLLRRAREMYHLVKHNPDPKEPVELRTVWRAGHEPRLVHWLVAGTATAGDCVAFEDRDFTACGAEVTGIYVGEETKYGRGLMDEQPVTCPKCLALLRAVVQAAPWGVPAVLAKMLMAL
jgi:hypothetical protein